MNSKGGLMAASMKTFLGLLKTTGGRSTRVMILLEI
jgi:hypothetical protein